MIKKILIICLLTTFAAKAQKASYTDRANAYIQQYSAWAVEEQLRSGIPASITLAQGIYETSAGESELATQANNHFGIKCKKEWRGETFAHTDDAPNECFRKYSCAKDSYKDHSDYLKNSPRYAALFSLHPSNYTAWATGLKRCGYATNPQYAQKLIKMVEDFNLQQYTLAALDKSPGELIPDNSLVYTASVSAAAPQTAVVTDAVYQTGSPAEEGVQLINGIKAIWCHQGDMLLDKAVQYKVRYARLLEINELPDAPLPRDMYVYLEKKNVKGAHATHVVQEGERIAVIAHEEGMYSRQLRIFNLLAQNEEPVAGSVLKLQEQSDERPATYPAGEAPKTVNGNVRLVQPAGNSSDYLPTRRSPAAAQEEEVAIGYGAERPAAVPAAETVPAARKEVVNTPVTIVPPPATEPVETVKTGKVAAVPTTTPEEEPQDDLARLKARLDKAVYARSSNVKVSRNDKENPLPPVTAAPQVLQQQAQSSDAVYHTVQKGETAYGIAQKYQIRVQQLREWNNLNFEGIKTGQKLRVK